MKELSAGNLKAGVAPIVCQLPSCLTAAEGGRRMAEYGRDWPRQAGVETEVCGAIIQPEIVQFRGDEIGGVLADDFRSGHVGAGDGPGTHS